MKRLSINLPTKYRLDLKLVKRRNNLDEISLRTLLGKVQRVRRGSKISRFFRTIFENNKIKRILGTNLAIMVVATSFFPENSTTFGEPEENVIAEVSTVLTTEVAIQYPVEKVKITQGYKFYHPGIDFDGITGDPIYPIMKGKVEAIQYSKYAYGNAILIDHGRKITSLYAHLSKIFVEKNQEVDTNSVIGAMGSTGQASGDHLHLEIRENGHPINPLTVLPN